MSEDRYSQVTLDQFEGPLDLLLYLVRKEEVALEALPIARITEPFLAFVERIETVDLDRAGDFLVMAAQLLEWKAKALLPAPPPPAVGAGAGPDDGRQRLVQELLQYRALKERARGLAEKADERARRFERESERRYEDVPALENASLWDLLTAFQRLEKAIGAGLPMREIEADEEPLSVYVERLRGEIGAAPGPVRFTDLFAGVRTRAVLVATFLAILELVRQGAIRARQDQAFGEIVVEQAGPV